MEAARADPVLVLEEGADLGELVVVPLGLAGDGRADQPPGVVVVVLVGLDRLPPEEPLVADPEVSGESQSLSECGVVDEPLDEKKGERTTLSSCIATTAVTRSRRSA